MNSKEFPKCGGVDMDQQKSGIICILKNKEFRMIRSVW
jgi:hypothetical protein